jgi:uncharacterized Zn finger protein
MGRWEHEFDYFPPSVPRATKGGIKAQSKRGAFGQSWWAKRWIQVLESFHIGGRLDRGRSYARKGQVVSIEIDTGQVKAIVQGSDPTPYQVTIGLPVLSNQDWKKLAKALSRQALFSVKLLAGEMPQDIEQAFADSGLSLFPAKMTDLETDCSCPDWSNPCKHIAAVYYLLGEEFDRDPFLIFKLRGMLREELVGLLKSAGPEPTSKKKTKKRLVNEQAETPPAPEPLATDAAIFWGGGDLPENLFGEVAIPPIPAALPKRLGNFPFWRGEERFLDAITPVYTQASPRGLELFLGEREKK